MKCWAVRLAATLLCGLCAARATVAQDGSPFPEPGRLAGSGVGEIVLKSGTWDGARTDFGYVLVPENRTDPRSRLLELPFIRQHAVESPKAPPVFLLGGGPGQSNLWAELPPVFRAENDLVRVGYRGVDGSVKLICPQVGRALAEARPLSPEGIARTRDALRECHGELAADGVDIDGYNMVEVADDVEAVRKALGYDSIQLFSTSYGTQLADIYSRRYPEATHRSLMIGASSRARRFVWDVETVEGQLRGYADLWRADPEAAARTPDLLGTIRGVLDSLPAEWRGVPLDRDKLRLATFHLLYETGTAAAVLDAYVAASGGDMGGLAVICLGYDEDVQSTSRRYWGEFFSKIVSGGFPAAGAAAGAADTGVVLGSPANELWAAAGDGGWPIETIPEEYCRLASIAVPTLVLNGGLDFSSPPEQALELEAHLTNGTVVLLPGMGHMDVVRLQREAFEAAVSAFFIRGEIDTSGYRRPAPDFTPGETFQDYARELLGEDPPLVGE